LHDNETAAKYDREIGKRLRAWRVSQGTTMVELAARLSISYQQVQKYEVGTNRMTVGMAVAAAEALNASPEIIFGFERISPELADLLAQLQMIDSRVPRERILAVLKALAVE